MTSLLLIEDDRTFSRIVEGFLTKHDFSVTVSYSGKEGLDTFRKGTFPIVLLDYRLPDMLGMEVLEEIKRHNPSAVVIIMTSFSDLRTAVQAIKAGALEYITKPIIPDELLVLLKGALQSKSAETNVSLPSRSFVEGNSAVAQQLHEYIRLVAPTDLSVIIMGESGTGKEQVARTIHQLSKRSEQTFIAVDCGALSKDLAASELFGHQKGAFTGALQNKSGRFEEANGGTLFLDEVGNLSYEVQVKLLRAIQERVIVPIGGSKEIKVDVRIIAATNDDLVESGKTGSFREDLYHRLNEFKLTVPPLRSRMDDLIEFMNFFRMQANQELQRSTIDFAPDIKELFARYDWPGNLREMRNIVRRAVLLTSGEIIAIDALPAEMIQAASSPPSPAAESSAANHYDLKALQETQERDMIMRTLLEVKYNKSKAARLLNIDRKTLYLKMEKYKIE